MTLIKFNLHNKANYNIHYHFKILILLIILWMKMLQN